MNWLDRLVGYLDPAAGFHRVRMRRAIDVLLAYEGAKVGRRTGDWVTTGGSANAEIGGALTLVRERARDLVRNNHFAARAVNSYAVNIVGTGIMPRARSGDEAIDAKIDELFNEWSERCDADGLEDFYGLQALVTRTCIESGEVLVRLRNRLPEDDLPVPLQLQVLEPDLLDQTKTEPTKDGGFIIQGVEFDGIGRRIAYWLFPQHPGEVAIITKSRLTSQRVDAASILHIFKRDRPGQVRAVSWFAPVILKMRDLAEYEEAELVRKKVEACFAGFVTLPEGAGDGTIAPTETKDGKRISTLSPGMIEYLKPGESMMFGSPAGVPGYADYKRAQIHDIAAGLGLPYELLSGDLSQVNYSSIRAGMLEFWRMVDAFQWLTLIPRFCIPAWSNFFKAAALSQRKLSSRLQNVDAEWTPPVKASVDREKEAKADLVELRTGTKTLRQAIAEKGYDPISQIEEIADTNALLDKLGIVLDCDPRKVAKTGAAQKEVDDEGQDSDPAARR